MLEREIKFVFNNERAMSLLRYISETCRPDPEFPHGIINTIYYDSPRLSYLAEKANSDFLKTKFRARWYGHIDDATKLPNEYFIEIKSRTGGLRSKFRICIDNPERHIGEFALEHPYLSKVSQLLKEQGIVLKDHLVPVILIRYNRRRFVDSSSGTRISLDSDITVPKFSRRVLPLGRKVTLRSAVVEVKGGNTELPPSLSWRVNFGLRKASFSKYLVCVEKCAGFEVGL